MPYVNIKVTDDRVITEEKAALIQGVNAHTFLTRQASKRRGDKS